MTTITIQLFAALKDYFSPTISLSIEDPTIEGLIQALEKLNPEAKSILQASRFASNEIIRPKEFKLKNNETIYILPPSSGG